MVEHPVLESGRGWDWRKEARVKGVAGEQRAGGGEAERGRWGRGRAGERVPDPGDSGGGEQEQVDSWALAGPLNQRQSAAVKQMPMELRVVEATLLLPMDPQDLQYHLAFPRHMRITMARLCLDNRRSQSRGGAGQEEAGSHSQARQGDPPSQATQFQSQDYLHFPQGLPTMEDEHRTRIPTRSSATAYFFTKKYCTGFFCP